MLDNEKEEAVETQKDSTDEVAEGYSHLTKADLNPDYVPETVETEESEKDSSQEETETETEYNINGATYGEGDLNTKMVKDYENLTSFVGKQSKEIGGYKSEIEELRLKVAELEVESEEDDLDPVEDAVFSSDKVKELAKKQVEEIMAQNDAKAKEQTQKQEFDAVVDSARDKFIESNPDFTEDKIIELVNKAAEKGIRFNLDSPTEDALVGYFNMLAGVQGGTAKTQTKNKKSSNSAEKIMEASKVKTNLSDASSSDKDDIDYDSMSANEWAKIPQSKRMQLLGIN